MTDYYSKFTCSKIAVNLVSRQTSHTNYSESYVANSSSTPSFYFTSVSPYVKTYKTLCLSQDEEAQSLGVDKSSAGHARIDSNRSTWGPGKVDFIWNLL